MQSASSGRLIWLFQSVSRPHLRGIRKKARVLKRVQPNVTSIRGERNHLFCFSCERCPLKWMRGKCTSFFFAVLNVAAGKAPMQSSVSEGGIPQKAVDGSTSTFFDADTCSLTEVERAPWWYVNLLEPYMVQLVRVDFGQSCCGEFSLSCGFWSTSTFPPQPRVVRPPSLCAWATTGRTWAYTPSATDSPARWRRAGRSSCPATRPCRAPSCPFTSKVSQLFKDGVKVVSGDFLTGPPGVSLSICEAFVYTDQALPIERCPSFRDQPPGSTATYNGKCYIFYNQQPDDFQGAMDFCEQRGGSLVDESNPALQGFLSWELWRRHKGDANGQYWLGAVRDREDPKSWKWISGKPVSVSFWNLPGGNDNCARFDGTKGWLWSDTNCGLNLNFICQHRKFRSVNFNVNLKSCAYSILRADDVRQARAAAQLHLADVAGTNFTPVGHGQDSLRGGLQDRVRLRRGPPVGGPRSADVLAHGLLLGVSARLPM